MHGDLPFVELCQTEAARLRRNIGQNGWDGEWYLRAYFDNGTPLGKAESSHYGPYTVVIQTGRLFRQSGEIVIRVFICVYRAAFDEGD